jgi:hypothetical protein
MKVQVVRLWWDDGDLTEYVDLIGSEDAWEARISLISHLEEGYQGSLTHKTIE